jgi:hypothetical protein
MVTRVYNNLTNGWTYTALGRNWYNRQVSRYVVHIPTRHEGTRASGAPYSRENTVPVKGIELPFGLSVEARDARIKADIEARFPDRVVGEFSGEIIKLVDGPFTVTEMVSEPIPGGQIETTVTTREL